MTQLKRLSPTQIKIIKGKVAGKKNRTIAKEVLPNLKPHSAEVLVSKELKKIDVQEELQKAFIRHGITIDAATKPIADGLKAKDVKNKPDHPTRLKASHMAFNLMGLGRNNDTGTTNNYVFVTGNQRDRYQV